jgi:KDO2-lipid IV(A) lauroyltransferase
MKINKSHIRRETVLALAYPFLVVAMLFLWICPLFLRKKIEIFAGKIYYKMGKKARDNALRNLKSAYPQLSETEIELMAKDVFTNVGGCLLDFFAKVYVKKPKNYFKFVKVVGEQNLKTAYDKGKGVICLIPHLSSWELSAVTPPMLGYKTIAASKPIKGALIQKSMVWFRARRGMKNFERGGSYQNLVDGLQNGNCLILMIDQDTNVKGCFVEFFGRETYTPLGAARLAADTGAAVVPMAMQRLDTGKYLFEILPELPFTKNTEDFLKENTQAQSKAIENFIRKNPTQWVWMHRRWKTTPESLAQWLKQRAKDKKM